MRTVFVTDPEALDRLEPAWADLFDRVPQATPFSSPAWLIPWWRSFAPGVLATVAVDLGDRLVALAPLYIEEETRRLLPLGIGLSDYADVLLDPAHAEAAGDALVRAIGSGRAGWEVWSAEDAPPGAAVLALLEPPGLVSRRASQAACPMLDLPATGDDLARHIPARKLRKWRMAEHRVARREWRIDRATPASLESDLDELFRLHALRWRSKGEAGVLSDEAVRRFHAAATPALLAAGLLRLTVLRIDGTVAGVHYGLVRRGASYAYLGGFDPAFAFESPGTLLIGEAITAAVAEGARMFDFLRGREAYKYEWGAVDRWTTTRLFEPVR